MIIWNKVPNLSKQEILIANIIAAKVGIDRR